jgi:hypothetical protein
LGGFFLFFLWVLGNLGIGRIIFKLCYMKICLMLLEYSPGQSWVTRETRHAHCVLRRWIWLISNWNHANVVMRFKLWALLVYYFLCKKTVGFSTSLLYYVHICFLLSYCHRSVFGAGITLWKWPTRITPRVAAQRVVHLMTKKKLWGWQQIVKGYNHAHCAVPFYCTNTIWWVVDVHNSPCTLCYVG